MRLLSPVSGGFLRRAIKAVCKHVHPWLNSSQKLNRSAKNRPDLVKNSRTLSRRSFIRQTLAAGTVPLIIPGGLWGAESPPNDRITLGFIGMGRQNQGLVRGFLGQKGTQVVAVCDVDTTRRAAARDSVEEHYSGRKSSGAFKGCQEYEDFRRLLDREDIDGVVIATPDHWHAIISNAAARAGKDIYCEKPMSHSLEEGRSMVNAVRNNKRVFQTGSMQRSSSEFRVACELVRNGAIGTVDHVDVAVGGPGVPCDLPAEEVEPGLDWDRWLGPAPVRPYNSVLSPRGVHTHFPHWRDYREYGGGGVTDWGAHHFDIAHWGLGFDESGPVEILPPAEPDATHGARVRYATGVEIRHVSGNGVTFHGDRGRIYVNRREFQMWIGGKQVAEDRSFLDQMLAEYLPANAVRLYESRHHLENWLTCMRTRSRPICDVETGARTSAVCNLVNLAYYHRQRLEWDPQAETFVNGTGDPQWLKHDYRSPWSLG